MDESKGEPEILKAKKLRRTLLLITDKELKSNTKRDLNFKIDSKTIQELNQAYNSYSILLSETSSIYSNFVQLRENMFPVSDNEIKGIQISSVRGFDQIINSLDSSFESSPNVTCVPKKIDLGEKKFILRKKDLKNNPYSPTLFPEVNPKEAETNNKSTKFRNKNIYRMIERIVNKKLIPNLGDDENVMRNIIKLRNYCHRIIGKRKKNKKSLKSRQDLSQRKYNQTKGFEKPRLIRKKTLHNFTNFFISSVLLGSKEKNDGHEKIASKEKKNLKTRYNPKVKIVENNNKKKNSNDKNFNKLKSFNNLEIIKENSSKRKNSDVNKRLRSLQTLIIKNQPQNIDKLVQKIDKNENNDTLNKKNSVSNGKTVSTMSIRPLNFLVFNNIVNNVHMNYKKDIVKKQYLLDSKNTNFKKQKTTKVKNENQLEKMRNLYGKITKRTIKLLSPELEKS